MQNKDKLLDDLARMAGGTMSVLSGMTKQVQQDIRSRVDELALKMDLVPREEFDRLEALVIKQREELNALKKEMGSNKGAKNSSPKKATLKKSAVKKPVKKTKKK